jgi:hypothetical protein
MQKWLSERALTKSVRIRRQKCLINCIIFTIGCMSNRIDLLLFTVNVRGQK